MTAWSQSEANRTLDEAKRRSLTDPEFRALALSDPMAALAKINPRQIPVGSLRFIENKDAAPYLADPKVTVVILPDMGTLTEDADELTDDDLEKVAGGGGPNPPTPPDPPIGNS